MFRDELQDLKDRYLGRFALLFVMSREQQDVAAFHGRIDRAKCDALFETWIDVASLDVAFICGPEEMTRAATASLLAHGLPATHIKSELFAAGAGSGRPMRPRSDAASASECTAYALLDGRRRAFTIERGKETVLDAGLRQGLDLPYSCKGRGLFDVPRGARRGRGRYGRALRARRLRNSSGIRADVPELCGDGDARHRRRFALACLSRETALASRAADVRMAEIRTAGIVGAGTMGAGIAMNFANAGIPVRLVDASSEALERAGSSIETAYAAAVQRGRLSRDAADERLTRVRCSVAFEDLGGVDIVVEAVFEDLAIKRDVFARLGAVCGAETLLATNTSTLDVDAIAEAAPHPERSLGLHFFSPAHVMKLVEVVRGARTSAATLAEAARLAQRLGKVPVVVGNCDGFVGNRMLLGYKREAEYLLLAGATPERVDGALRAFGFAMGIFAVSDLAGIDVGWRSKRERIKRGAAPAYAVTDLPDALVAAGRLGQKTGRGYFRYEPGKRAPQPESGHRTVHRGRTPTTRGTRRKCKRHRDRRALRLRTRQRRREDFRRGHRVLCRRHRYDLGERLWIPESARRPDALCGERRPGARVAYDPPLRAVRPGVLAHVAPARECRASRQFHVSERQAYLCDAVRTPIGKYGGALASVRPDDLGAVPIAALIERNPDCRLGCARRRLLRLRESGG